MNAVMLLTVVLTAGAAPEEGGAQLEIPSVLLSVIREVYVPARTAGVLTEITVREGQQVARGEIMARIEDDDVQVAKERAEIELEIVRKRTDTDIGVRLAQKTLLVAQAELKRAVTARAEYRKSIAESEMDRLRLTVDRDLLAIEQAHLEYAVGRLTRSVRENELKAVLQDLQRRKIDSPLNGVVVDVEREQGEWVEPGETVFRIIQLDRLQAETFLHVRQAGRVRPGCSVVLTAAAEDAAPRQFSGRIVFVSPEVDPVNGQFRIRAEIENTNLELRPGTRGNMTIDLGTAGSESDE